MSTPDQEKPQSREYLPRPKKKEEFEAIKKNISQIYLPLHNRFGLDDLVFIPSYITGERSEVPLHTLRSIVFDKMVEASVPIPRADSTTMELEESSILASHEEFVSTEEQFTKYQRNPRIYPGQINRKSLSEIFALKNRKAKQTGEKRKTQLTEEEAERVFTQRHYPYTEEKHEMLPKLSYQIARPHQIPTQPDISFSSDEHHTVPDWMKGKRVKLMMMRSLGAKGTEKQAVFMQNELFYTIGLWTSLKFAYDTQTQVISRLFSGGRIWEESDSKFRTAFDRGETENLNGLSYFYQKYAKAVQDPNTFIIPIVSIGADAHTRSEEEHLASEIAGLTAGANMFSGFSIILESPFKNKSIVDVLQYHFGKDAEDYLKKTLILHPQRETVTDDIKQVFSYVVNNIKQQ